MIQREEETKAGLGISPCILSSSISSVDRVVSTVYSKCYDYINMLACLLFIVSRLSDFATQHTSPTLQIISHDRLGNLKIWPLKLAYILKKNSMYMFGLSNESHVTACCDHTNRGTVLFCFELKTSLNYIFVDRTATKNNFLENTNITRGLHIIAIHGIGTAKPTSKLAYRSFFLDY